MKNLISLVLCTLGQRREELKRLVDSLRLQTYQNFELVVVSQGNHELIRELLSESGLRFKHIETDRKGLSRARNIGLQSTKGDIITISDDDCWYPPYSMERVNHLFNHYRGKYSVICLQIYDPFINQYYKSYGKVQKSINIYEVGKCSSIEIFYRAQKESPLVKFDERFGLGAKYPSSEENIFLADLLKRGYKILYLPDVIVYHRARANVVSKFNKLRMVTAFKMFIRIFGFFKGSFLYYGFLLKHFGRVENKLSSFFPFIPRAQTRLF